jgi:2-keto-4-pentenoate hydratase/2-oxohepta-3-ene-1,7-dioic acid hydratase in catechol pathway
MLLAMKLARFDDDRFGVLLADDRVVDVAASVPAYPEADEEMRQLTGGDAYVDWIPLIEAWDRIGPALTGLVEWASSDGRAVLKDVGAIRFRAPLPTRHARIFALGANFAKHVEEGLRALGREGPDKPLSEQPLTGFHALPETTIGPEDEFTAPAGAECIDYEAEAAVVLASGGRDLSNNGIRIWGYTGWNDLSIRDLYVGRGLTTVDQGGVLTWALQKNWDGGNSCGVFMVVGEGDPSALRLVSRVNGEVRQNGSTSDMVRTFGEGAEYLSRFLTLKPGDMILSGTPNGTAVEQGPEGPYLEPGDVIEVEAGDAGVLRNTRAG